MIKTNSKDDLKKLILEEDCFTNLYGCESKEIENSYAEKLYAIVSDVIKEKTNLQDTELEMCDIHTVLEEKYKVYDDKYGINQLSNYLYDLPREFNDYYLDFLKFNVRKYIGEDFYFPKTPTVRIQTPHDSSSPFYPFYHSDILLGHPPYEINIWIPLTPPSEDEGHGFCISNLDSSLNVFKTFDFNWEEMKKNKKRVNAMLEHNTKSVITDFKKTLIFDSRVFHSTIPRKNHSRISMDIRIVLRSRIDKDKEKNMSYNFQTNKTKVPYAPGGAYFEESIDLI